MPDVVWYEDCWVYGMWVYSKPIENVTDPTTRFHCLFCHGYEERGAASAGILAVGSRAPADRAMYLARYANRLADKVTIHTNGDENVTTSLNAELSKSKFEFQIQEEHISRAKIDRKAREK